MQSIFQSFSSHQLHVQHVKRSVQAIRPEIITFHVLEPRQTPSPSLPKLQNTHHTKNKCPVRDANDRSKFAERRESKYYRSYDIHTLSIFTVFRDFCIVDIIFELHFEIILLTCIIFIYIIISRSFETLFL